MTSSAGGRYERPERPDGPGAFSQQIEYFRSLIVEKTPPSRRRHDQHARPGRGPGDDQGATTRRADEEIADFAYVLGAAGTETGHEARGQRRGAAGSPP